MLLQEKTSSRGRDVDFAPEGGASLNPNVSRRELDRQPLNAVAHDHARVMTVPASVLIEDVAHVLSRIHCASLRAVGAETWTMPRVETATFGRSSCWRSNHTPLLWTLTINASLA